MEVTLKGGKRYKICSCGLSKSLPFCDNKHREFNAENGTEYKSVKITPDNDTTIVVNSSKWNNNEENK